MANNNQVAVVDSRKFAEFIGENIAVMKSAREGAKYPLYLKTKIGPIHLNTRAAQDFVLENGLFNGADNLPEKPEPGPEQNPENPEPEQAGKRGFLDGFLTLD